jgi:hypothetical protein
MNLIASIRKKLGRLGRRPSLEEIYSIETFETTKLLCKK